MRRSRLLLVVSCALIGFVAVTAARTRPANPESRLPRQYRLADLIEQEQAAAARLRTEVEQLRARVNELRTQAASRRQDLTVREQEIKGVSLAAGLVAVRGPGLRITLDDSHLDEAPSGNVNDLVVHSQDLQGVVNAVWRAGAEAVAINGQRLVGTSAVLCVGNTLLLNGTVSSPPYVVTAVGASRDRFEADTLVKRLHDDAEEFGLRFSVSREDDVEAPAYQGATRFNYAKRAAAGDR